MSTEKETTFTTDPTTDWSWMEASACRTLDREIFFPVREEDAPAALQVCSTCLVRRECLEFALANGERYGVWGGTTENERAKLLEERRSLRRAG